MFAAGETVPQILLYLAREMRSVVIEPVHELGVAQLLPKDGEVGQRRLESLGGIGDAGRIQLEEVRREGPLESQPQRLQGARRHSGDQRV